MPLTIQFQPEGRTFTGQGEISLSLAASACDILIDQPCGERATCGKCRVRMLDGAVPPTSVERKLISGDDLERGWRLACQTVLNHDAVVEVPLVTRMIVQKGFGDRELFRQSFAPAVVKSVVQPVWPPPAPEAKLDALAEMLGIEAGLHLSVAPLRKMASLCAAAQSEFTLVLEGDELIAAEAGDTTAGCYGLAYDLGSTSVAGALIDLDTGIVVAEASELNPQIAYGADVISRIHFAQTHQGGTQRLQEALLTAIRRILARLIETSGVKPDRIYAAMMVGNPTIEHTLLGVDPTCLGHAPYLGVWTQSLAVKARELGIAISENANVHLLPMIRSHVGSDTVAAILASQVNQGAAWKLLIDLGTNSEVVLANRDRIVVTSTAAGPAFEGMSLHHGMRAAPGAIEAIYIGSDGSFSINTIGGDRAKGICGTGLIDAAARLLQIGLVSPSGYFKSATEFGRGRWPDIQDRITEQNNHRGLILARAEETATGEPILVTANDIRQLQLVKGSIRAAITILCEHCGIEAMSLDEVLIAGAFGNYIRKSSALAIGLVPEIDPERIRFIGNAAGVGARLTLVDRRARERAELIRAYAEYVELAADPDYQGLFADAMRFPDPN
jgi:uncharacterized 2Fe-2S/4Fe-4S cluster protein (DUF4445 family)